MLLYEYSIYFMKKLFFILVLCLYPLSTFAWIEVFLDSAWTTKYSKDIWTSKHFPTNTSHMMRVDMTYLRESYPHNYSVGPQELRALIFSLFDWYTPTQKQNIYKIFLDFNTQDFSSYIGIALSPQTENNISEKRKKWFSLSPFERRFESCKLDLSQRRNIVQNLLLLIKNQANLTVDTLRYSDQKFGDCIIPFPDVRRTPTQIQQLKDTSFPSNLAIAQLRSGKPKSFWIQENSQTILKDLVLPTGISSPKTFVSTRVDNSKNIPKELGKDRVLLVHQNGYMNPFVDKNMKRVGNIYKVSGINFIPQNASQKNILFLSSSDSTKKRTLGSWKKIKNGVYKKTLIQENTYWRNPDGVYIPRQRVGITEYYAIVYKHDETEPICKNAFFSTSSDGDDTFSFSKNTWFQNPVYWYFQCQDIEWECWCDSSVSGCFSRNGDIFSTPQQVSHNARLQYNFKNFSHVSKTCSTPTSPKILYDFQSPDIEITIGGKKQNTLKKEFVQVNGALYDGVWITHKRLYNIKNDFSFEATGSLDITLRIYDPSAVYGQGTSWLNSYQIRLSEANSTGWDETYTFTKDVSNKHPSRIDFSFWNDPRLKKISQTAWVYRVIVSALDQAKNELRTVWYFSIIPWKIDATKSILTSSQKNIHYADDSSTYEYTLVLKDVYWNTIPERKFSNISHTCFGVSDCKELRADMSGMNPTGATALSFIPNNGISDIQGRIKFRVASIAPGKMTESFQLTFTEPSRNIVFSGTENIFLKPFTWVLETQEKWTWVSDILPVNTPSKFRLRIRNETSLHITPSVEDFSSFLHGRHPKTWFTLSWALQTSAYEVHFWGTFYSSLDPEESHKTLLEVKQGTVSGAIISYIVGGKTVRYRLSPDTLSKSPILLTYTRELENPVKIIGLVQWVGNSTNITERKNISDINSMKLRNDFRKYVISTVKNMKSWTIVWNIKYIDKTNDLNKNFILNDADIKEYETLVVRNGNIMIQGNFNTFWGGKNIGIISILDEAYILEDGYKKVGNIYIEAGVSYMKAIIYTDGALVSTQNGTPILLQESNRDTILNTQLFIQGSVFSRNTLSGWRAVWGKYVLPWGQESSDESLARQYDMYYLRRGNEGCSKDIYGFCDIPHYTIIKYDTEALSNPPILFSK